MPTYIRPYEPTDLEPLYELTLLAFEPVFASFRQLLGPGIFPNLYPNWQQSQTDWVDTLVREDKYSVWVAVIEGNPVGLIAYSLDLEKQTAEVQFLVVHPDYQNDGIGTELNTLALEKMREAGIKLVEVGTGGDDSHAPARRAYEKAGYTPLPLVRYYQSLGED
ncbi:MAG: GNAT family N-acetyltransferase [Anaerolineaceae bacterium]|mgnify:CR=1 FL=1|nr:GNAT family N-acetyltransferase [Anaerolineaceae bacterium]